MTSEKRKEVFNFGLQAIYVTYFPFQQVFYSDLSSEGVHYCRGNIIRNALH